ncbi:DsbA family oxidoreductase [Actinospongicola halichondriae]|uniref:DsbA family oxidoreductase n=1 Tax=Actinospongicola halichondriae TaxID=3236844 RepID=UPI003D5A9DC3
MPADLEIYADVVCPFTHAGLTRAIASLPGSVEVRIHPWPLEWVNDAPLDPAHVAAEIRAMRSEVAPTLFQGFDEAAFPTTSLPALAAAERAYRVGNAEGLAVSLALRDALFEQGRDIGDPAITRAVLEAAGLDDATEADRAAVAQGYEAGKARGVDGSPHYFTAGGSWFCPGLDISKVDGEFVVRPDTGPFEELLAALGAAGR